MVVYLIGDYFRDLNLPNKQNQTQKQLQEQMTITWKLTNIADLRKKSNISEISTIFSINLVLFPIMM